jgi:hypothetical protein
MRTGILASMNYVHRNTSTRYLEVASDLLPPSLIVDLASKFCGKIQWHQHVLPRTPELTTRFLQEFGKEDYRWTVRYSLIGSGNI